MDIINTEKYNKFLFILMGFISFIFPLSINGNMISSYLTLFIWVLLMVSIVLMMIFNKVNFHNFFLCLLILCYLFLSTTLILSKSKDFEFNVSRLIPVLCIVLFFSVNKVVIKDKKFIIRIYDMICIIVILINIFSLLRVGNVNEFISNFYTQSEKYITDYQLTIFKPIGFFGAHNIASFIYTGLFIISLEFYFKQLKKRYLFFLIAFFMMNILLRSTTSFCYMFFMIGILLMKSKKAIKPTILIIIVFCSLIFIKYPDIIDNYMKSLFSANNGFIPRYVTGDNSLYKANFDVLYNNPFGIGFTTNESLELFYADSDYIALTTMGGIMLPLLMYILFIKFVNINVTNKFIKIVFLLYVFSIEFGLTSFMYLKSIAFYIFIIIIINSILND